MKEKLFKKGITRRLFSVVLALTMVIAVLPTYTSTVFAASYPTKSLKCDKYNENPGMDCFYYTAPFDVQKDYCRHTCITHSMGVGIVEHTVGVECPYCGTTKPAHTCSSGVKQNGQAATCTADGFNDYYKCGSCDKLYKEAACTNEITDLATWKTTDGQGKIAALGHAWGYNASGATLTATCIRDSAHTATLTLSASSANYSGSPVSASLEGTTAWTAAGLTAPTIKYVGRGTTTYTESETAPTASGAYTAKITAGTATATKDFDIIPPHTHSWSYTFDNNQHWQECSSCTETQGQADHSWVRSADGSTTKCETCGAYVTVSAESGVTPKTVKDCVKITTNLPTTPTFVVMDTSEAPAVEVALNTSAEGNYQAVAQVKSGVNPYADFTLTNPKTTAATGDNRPIELLVFGFAAMSVMAAAAFTMDRKRR